MARGSVVDEAALVTALEEGRIAGAGLDVCATEPHVPEALLGRDDVVLLPHVASGTVETRRAMADLVLDNVERFLADGTFVTPVDRPTSPRPPVSIRAALFSTGSGTGPSQLRTC